MMEQYVLNIYRSVFNFRYPSKYWMLHPSRNIRRILGLARLSWQLPSGIWLLLWHCKTLIPALRSEILRYVLFSPTTDT